jgi:murein DD-endopeptidase MepM/ murein hydrolase activator NlpD
MLALLLVIALAGTPPMAQPDGPAWSAWPAAGTVTSPFGNDAGRWHPGIDIGMLRSGAVRAAEPGRVIAVGERRRYEGYGNVVQVAVGGGFTALYAHLAGWGVRVGDEIGAGQRIGTAGCTGWCSGEHLHFELRLRGVPVNPMRFFRAAHQYSEVRRAASFCFRSGAISSTAACLTKRRSSSSKR